MPSLRSVKLVHEVERSFAAACERGEFRVVHYSLQSDHVHLINEARDRLALGRGMKSIGARLARAVNRVFRRRGPVLADRYHSRALRTPREVRNALAYVLLNARRHLAKRLGRRCLGRAQGIDPASSGRWFDGWREREIDSGLGQSVSRLRDSRPPVERPETWLLREGWRRHGLLSPHEVPGGSTIASALRLRSTSAQSKQ